MSAGLSAEVFFWTWANLNKYTDKRPVGRMRNQFNSINTFAQSYYYIITLKPFISFLKIKWSLFVKP